MDVETGSFAVSKGERMPLAPPSPGRVHVHLVNSSRVGIGVTTSRRCSIRDFWELAAWKAGCTIAEAKRRARQ